MRSDEEELRSALSAALYGCTTPQQQAECLQIVALWHAVSEIIRTRGMPTRGWESLGSVLLYAGDGTTLEIVTLQKEAYEALKPFLPPPPAPVSS